MTTPNDFQNGLSIDNLKLDDSKLDLFFSNEFLKLHNTTIESLKSSLVQIYNEYSIKTLITELYCFSIENKASLNIPPYNNEEKELINQLSMKANELINLYGYSNDYKETNMNQLHTFYMTAIIIEYIYDIISTHPTLKILTDNSFKCALFAIYLYSTIDANIYTNLLIQCGSTTKGVFELKDSFVINEMFKPFIDKALNQSNNKTLFVISSYHTFRMLYFAFFGSFIDGVIRMNDLTMDIEQVSDIMECNGYFDKSVYTYIYSKLLYFREIEELNNNEFINDNQFMYNIYNIKDYNIKYSFGIFELLKQNKLPCYNQNGFRSKNGFVMLNSTNGKYNVEMITGNNAKIVFIVVKILDSYIAYSLESQLEKNVLFHTNSESDLIKKIMDAFKIEYVVEKDVKVKSFDYDGEVRKLTTKRMMWMIAVIVVFVVVIVMIVNSEIVKIDRFDKFKQNVTKIMKLYKD